MRLHDIVHVYVYVYVCVICVHVSMCASVGCDNLSGNPTVHVASTGEHRLIPNSNVTVTCTAAPSSSILPLSWWMVAQNNSFQALHGHPGYIVKSGYDKLHCRWTSLLTITNFSAELAGEYMCSVGLSHDAVKLQMGGKDEAVCC